MIEELCRAGVSKIDCGLGDAVYKQTFGDRWRPEIGLMVFAPTVRGAWINMARTAALGATRLGAAAARRLGIENRIKKIWRGAMRRKDG